MPIRVTQAEGTMIRRLDPTSARKRTFLHTGAGRVSDEPWYALDLRPRGHRTLGDQIATTIGPKVGRPNNAIWNFPTVLRRCNRCDPTDRVLLIVYKDMFGSAHRSSRVGT